MGLIVPVACLTHCVLWLFVLITEGGVSARDSCDSELFSSSSFCTCMNACTYNGSCPKKVSFVLEKWAANVQCQWNMSDCIQAVYLFILSCNEVKGYKFILEVFLSMYVSRFYLNVIFDFWLVQSVEPNLVRWCIMNHPPCVMWTCWFLSSMSRSQWGFIWLKNVTFCVYWAKSTSCFLTAVVLASLPCGPVE